MSKAQKAKVSKTVRGGSGLFENQFVAKKEKIEERILWRH